MSVWWALALVAAAAVGAFLYRRRSEPVSSVPSGTMMVRPAPATPQDNVAFETEATTAAKSSVFAAAFGVPHFDYRILGPHLEVFEAAKVAALNSMNDERYFPRRPAQLPKLLRALNAGDSSREEIVRLILQDPVLAGNVLKRANSAYYRQGAAVTESVDRAVVILGSEGLRAPVATAVMQPVFQLPRGFFDQFAPLTWELAQRTAVGAEIYARAHRVGDAFVAHLLGLLGGLGRIALFRMTLDRYRDHNIMPRAEVFIRVMLEHGLQVTRQVAAAWEMSPQFLEAIDAQLQRTAPSQMSPLARTLYFASLCGELAVLRRLDKFNAEDALTLLKSQGLDEFSAASIWTASSEADVA